MYQRLFAGCLLAACAVLGWMAWGLEAPFSYEPVGPRAYPLLLLVLLGAGALLLVVKPTLESGSNKEAPLSPVVIPKLLLCLGLLLALAALFERLGFVLTSVAFAYGMSRLFGGRNLQSIVAALVLGLGLYFLFDRILDVPLPLGVLAALEN